MSDTTRIRAEDQGDGQPENARAIQDESGGSAMTEQDESSARKGGAAARDRSGADDEQSDGDGDARAS